MPKEIMGWRRTLALAVPLAVVAFTLGFIVALEARRGPDWRLELDEYLRDHTAITETVRVQVVNTASRPWNFTAAMGTPEPGDWIIPSYPPQAVRCALLTRSSAGDGSVRQVVFVVHHSDALYRVGWLTYEGPREPFSPESVANLESIGCDLELE